MPFARISHSQRPAPGIQPSCVQPPVTPVPLPDSASAHLHLHSSRTSRHGQRQAAAAAAIRPYTAAKVANHFRFLKYITKINTHVSSSATGTASHMPLTPHSLGISQKHSSMST